MKSFAQWKFKVYNFHTNYSLHLFDFAAEKCGEVEIKCVVADFTQEMSIYNKIQEDIKDLDIGVLGEW